MAPLELARAPGATSARRVFRAPSIRALACLHEFAPRRANRDGHKTGLILMMRIVRAGGTIPFFFSVDGIAYGRVGL